MKKIVNVSISVVLVLVFLLANLQKHTVAAATKPLVAEGTWSTGMEVEVDLTTTSAPTWMQLLTKGVKITTPAKICHPFRGGKYHWVGEIRQLVKGIWVKLPTVSDWVPSTEGVFTACAQAPAAGTYALFGYYNGPLEIARDNPGGNPFDCSTVVWDAFLSGFVEHPVDLPTYYFIPYFLNVPFGTPVTYTVTSIVPDNIIGGTLTGYGTTGDNGVVFFGLDQLTKSFDDPWPTITVDFSLLGCTFTKVFPASNNT